MLRFDPGCSRSAPTRAAILRKNSPASSAKTRRSGRSSSAKPASGSNSGRARPWWSGFHDLHAFAPEPFVARVEMAALVPIQLDLERRQRNGWIENSETQRLPERLGEGAGNRRDEVRIGDDTRHGEEVADPGADLRAHVGGEQRPLDGLSLG